MPAPDFDTSSEREERRVPMTRLRARIADRLLAAQQNAAILTTFNEVDMQAVIDIRNRYKTNFLEAHHVKLGFMSFFIQACCEALKKFPEVNASIDDSDIVYHGYYDGKYWVNAPIPNARGVLPSIAFGSDGIMHVAWQDRITSADFYNIYYICATEFGWDKNIVDKLPIEYIKNILSIHLEEKRKEQAQIAKLKSKRTR